MRGMIETNRKYRILVLLCMLMVGALKRAGDRLDKAADVAAAALERALLYRSMWKEPPNSRLYYCRG